MSVPPTTKVKLGPLKTLGNGIQATNWNFGRKVIEREEFTFRVLDVIIKTEGEDYPAYSVGQWRIRGNEGNEWTTYNKDALYYVRQGEAWFMVGEEAKTLEIGYYICVPKETRHRILNQSKNIECIVDLMFPGRILLDD